MLARHLPAWRSPRLRWVAAITAGAAVVLLALNGSATAGPSGSESVKQFNDQPLVVSDPVPPGFSSWDEVNTVQERLGAVADQLHEAAQAPDGAGFGSIISEAASNRLRLYWKGAMPASVSALLARDTGVDVEVQPAAYSEAELLAEVTGDWPRAFAYPAGVHDAAARSAVAAAGMRAAFATHSAAGHLGVSRVDINSTDTSLTFRLKTARGYRPLRRAAGTLPGLRPALHALLGSAARDR